MQQSQNAIIGVYTNQIKWAISIVRTMDYLTESTKQKILQFANNCKKQCSKINSEQQEKDRATMEEQQRNIQKLDSEKLKTVYILRCNGLTFGEIATQMKYDERTIKRYWKKICEITEGR